MPLMRKPHLEGGLEAEKAGPREWRVSHAALREYLARRDKGGE